MQRLSLGEFRLDINGEVSMVMNQYSTIICKIKSLSDAATNSPFPLADADAGEMTCILPVLKTKHYKDTKKYFRLVKQ